jgi:hypothetical protein
MAGTNENPIWLTRATQGVTAFRANIDNPTPLDEVAPELKKQSLRDWASLITALS